MTKAPSSHGSAVVKPVKIGPLTAKLTQRGTGAHSGSWKITYKGLDGKLFIATVTLEMGHTQDMVIGTYLNPPLRGRRHHLVLPQPGKRPLTRRLLPLQHRQHLSLTPPGAL
ncbi:hypothetical protein OVA24_14030 [Luteolibacter sp. SL250]|uniref:hypothetical protein n=1 Tax=Luteolibacter sp. SL250 TaxID=2995170 RepID=UPI00226E5008|nr:hypothetical protein [Luteolibacter sp. SL250]WAC18352.1 hypothetical protein OVA24_14030 [Luteolibacter sp. SL250]